MSDERIESVECPRSFWGGVKHQWGKWEQYTWTGKIKPPFADKYYDAEENRQKRSCLRCGFSEDVKVSDD